MAIKKQGAQNWVVFERSCQGAQYSCLRGLQPLAARLHELGSKLERLRLLPLVQLRVKENIRATDHSSSERWDEIVEVHFAEMTGDRRLASERLYYTACKCCLNIFTKIKLLIVNRQFSWCFLSLFYFLSLISAFVMSLIEAFTRLRMRSCLFRCVFCRNLAKLVILVQF